MGSNGGPHAVQEPPALAICRLWRFFVWKGRGESGIGAVTGSVDGLDVFGTGRVTDPPLRLALL